jgi:C-terminal processing protease CtpA/Prc
MHWQGRQGTKLSNIFARNNPADGAAGTRTPLATQFRHHYAAPDGRDRTVAGLVFSIRGKGLALAAGCAAMVAACGGGGSNPAPPVAGGGGAAPAPTPAPSATCSLRSRQDWVLAQLQEWYLFPTLLDATVNPAAHTTVDSYIDALVAPARAQNRDRYFTYLTSIAEENAFYEQGETAGFGIRLGYDTANRRVFVIEAFEGGPALAGGIDRGTEIVAIGTQSVDSLMAGGGPQAVINALGPDTAGLSRQLTIRNLAGVQSTLTLSKAVFEIDPVSDRYGVRIIADGARRVGYLNMRTFIDTSKPNLRAAFAEFKAQGVTELIVDLRYNGGGLLSIAAYMIDLMGEGRAGQVNTYVTFRDSKAAENDTILFDPQPESIAPTKVAFIGTRSTASASEMVINGMVPYLGNNMALVGTNTYGKPVGQIALDRPQCDDRLRSVSFKLENANHQGEYFNGLATTVATTCMSSDDISRQLGDPDERMVRAALDYLAGRSCTRIAALGPLAADTRGVLAREAPQSTVQRELPGAF